MNKRKYTYINYFPGNDFTINELNDNKIKQLLVKKKQDHYILNSCRIKISWLKNHNIYNYLINRFINVTNIQEIIYLIFYNYKEKPKVIYCKTCNKPIYSIKFQGFLLGYYQYCSYKCSLLDKNKLISVNNKNITDNDIINHCIDNNGNLISTYVSKLHLQKKGYYNYLINRYNDNSKNTIQEIIYRIKNHIDIIPKCPICNKPVNFKRFHEGYRKYCTHECAIKSTNRVTQAKLARHNYYIQVWKKQGYDILYDPDNVNNFLVYNNCNIHNPFSIKHYTFYNRCKDTNIILCPICNPERNKETSIETIIKNILNDKNINYIQHNRSILKVNKELDFYIPAFNIAIECNGIYWHAGIKGKEKQQEKYNLCKKNNIKLFIFWEDTIKYKSEAIKSILYSYCQLNNKIYARNGTIKEISLSEAKLFIDTYHIQDYEKSAINLGFFYNNELLQVMTFNLLKNNNYILNTFCSKTNYTIIGGISKLLSYFKIHYKWNSIITYSINDICNGYVYTILGFKYIKNCKPNITYFNYKVSPKRIKNKQSKNTNIKYYECYDSGYKQYLMKNNNLNI